MDDMIDPQNIQIFSVDQSKYLYSVVTKENEKVKKAKARSDMLQAKKKKM